jgi:hypothetical protein
VLRLVLGNPGNKHVLLHVWPCCRSRTDGPFQGRAFRLYPQRYRLQFKDPRYQSVTTSTIDVSGGGSSSSGGSSCCSRMQASLVA